MGYELCSSGTVRTGSTFSNRLDVLSTPPIASGPCKQNSGCTETVFTCRLRGVESWYVVRPFSVVVSGPGGEGNGDTTAADLEPELILPDEEDVVAVSAPSSDPWDEIPVPCILND